MPPPRGVGRDEATARPGDRGPWRVAGPAIAIGRRALSDDAWLRAMHAGLLASDARLDTLLVRAGFAIIGGTPLFRLASHAAAQDMGDRLARAGIHIRRFAYRPDWLRFGIPADDSWARLEDALLAHGET